MPYTGLRFVCFVLGGGVRMIGSTSTSTSSVGVRGTSTRRCGTIKDYIPWPRAIFFNIFWSVIFSIVSQESY